MSSRLRSVWSNAAPPTTHNNERPYFTNAAGPSRNSPLPIETPSTITPGPIALNQPRPCGRGAGGSSPSRHGSRPERASGATASLTDCVLMVQKGLQHNALVVFFELLVWFYLAQSRGSLLDEVSTTCGSGWVNHSRTDRKLDTNPPATAGGTDLVQV